VWSTKNGLGRDRSASSGEPLAFCSSHTIIKALTLNVIESSQYIYSALRYVYVSRVTLPHTFSTSTTKALLKPT